MKLKTIRYKLAAFICGGELSQYEGRDRRGTWHKGLCIVSPEAMKAHRAAFRHDASVYSDTALVEPSVQNAGGQGHLPAEVDAATKGDVTGG